MKEEKMDRFKKLAKKLDCKKPEFAEIMGKIEGLIKIEDTVRDYILEIKELRRENKKKKIAIGQLEEKGEKLLKEKNKKAEKLSICRQKKMEIERDLVMLQATTSEQGGEVANGGQKSLPQWLKSWIGLILGGQEVNNNMEEGKLKKIGKVVLWTGLPYLLLKVVEVLAGLEGFASYSPLLNIVAYVAKEMLKRGDEV